MESRLTFLRDPDFKWGFLLFVIALAVRLVGISWGLPNDQRMETLHPDEPIVRQNSSRVDLAHGQLTPGFYNYGTLYLTLNSIGQKMADAYAPVDPKTPIELGKKWGHYYFVGRIMSAFAGSGLVWVVYAILRRRTNMVGAFAGGLVVCFAPGLVVHSRFQTVDMLATFLGMLGLFYALKIVSRKEDVNYLPPRGGGADGPPAAEGVDIIEAAGSSEPPHPDPLPFGSGGEGAKNSSPREGEVAPRDEETEGVGSVEEANPHPVRKLTDFSLQAGRGSNGEPGFWPTLAKSALWLGLSAGTKYTGGVLIVGLWLAIWLTDYPVAQKLKGIVASLGIMLAALLVATPGIVLDTQQFLRDFTYELGHTSTGHGFVFTATPPGFIMQGINLGYAMGIVLALIGLAGLIAGAYKNHAWLIVTLVSFVVFYLFIGRAEVKFVRYCFPLIPLLAVGFGWLMGQAHQNPNKKWSLVVGLGALSLVGLFGGGVKDTILYTGMMSGTDPRDEIGTYLATQQGSIGLPNLPWFYTPTIYPMAQLSKLDYFRMGKEALTHMPNLKVFDPESGKSVGQWLEEEKPDIVVFSSFESNDLDRIQAVGTQDPTAKTAAAQWAEFEAKIKAGYEPSMHRGGGPWLHDLMYIYPDVWVFKKKG